MRQRNLGKFYIEKVTGERRVMRNELVFPGVLSRVTGYLVSGARKMRLSTDRWSTAQITHWCSITIVLRMLLSFMFYWPGLL